MNPKLYKVSRKDIGRLRLLGLPIRDSKGSSKYSMDIKSPGITSTNIFAPQKVKTEHKWKDSTKRNRGKQKVELSYGFLIWTVF